ncbi:MarR family winged helix-turn-helix transcriptional regulator [Streptomyces sp. NPDC006645]|uniref:MarR family winged helix-turn-helix transcriptional regulator n=1 Tax=unclassified Streptomyces TaxID=2593676 RepID=UPI0033B44E9B
MDTPPENRPGTPAGNASERAPDDTPAAWQGLPTWLLTQTAHHAHRLVTDAFTAAGARGYHYRLLATLEEFGPSSQAGLSRRTGIHVSDTVGALNELGDGGLIERAPDPADRRRNVISLTAEGERHLRRLEKPLAEAQDELLAPLSPQERRRFTDYLSRLLDHHDRR